ncbi:MAG TPA: antitoxin Xre/MbcA/ParS toxin-binding domain-containing protein [Candidatus Angelobacter sp.]
MSAVHQQIGEWLGVAPAQTEQELLQIIERRLPTSSINRLLALGITRAEVDALVIPLRTLQHRRSRREKLTVEESDRILRLMRALSQAESVYGSRERALAWLRRPHARLSQRPPSELLKTDAGSRIVEELLIQIDEGFFA